MYKAAYVEPEPYDLKIDLQVWKSSRYAIYQSAYQEIYHICQMQRLIPWHSEFNINYTQN